MGVDEENLSDHLVSPEDVDDPNRLFTKGEEQPRGCRDVWAGILFYAQAIAVGVFCFWLGVPALTKQIDNTDQQGNSNGGYNVEYEGLLYLVMSAAACAFLLSGLSLGIMSCCPKILIQFSLLVSLAVSLAVCVYSFMYNSILGGVFGAIIFALSLCYACSVWRRIPFAAANLSTALTAVRKNSFIFIMAYIFVGITFGKQLIFTSLQLSYH
jgi:hypothetical protein